MHIFCSLLPQLPPCLFMPFSARLPGLAQAASLLSAPLKPSPGAHQEDLKLAHRWGTSRSKPESPALRAGCWGHAAGRLPARSVQNFLQFVLNYFPHVEKEG